MKLDPFKGRSIVIFLPFKIRYRTCFHVSPYFWVSFRTNTCSAPGELPNSRAFLRHDSRVQSARS